MTTRLTAPVRREIDIDGEPYTIVLGPDGIRLTRKRFRQGMLLSWRAVKAMGELERLEHDQER